MIIITWFLSDIYNINSGLKSDRVAAVTDKNCRIRIETR